MSRPPRQPASPPKSSQLTWAAPQTSCDSYGTRHQQPSTRPSLVPLLPAAMVTRSFARDRRNVSSPAREPSVTNASAHSVRASSCGHSSSHASVVRPVLSRRSCATIASCHAVKRAGSAAPSAVPTLEPSIAYRLISDPSFLVATDAPHVSNEQCSARSDGQNEACPKRASEFRSRARSIGGPCALAGCERSNQCDWIPSLRGDRRNGRCRCPWASARTALTAPMDSRRGSRLRHRRDEGRRQTRSRGGRH